MGASKLRREVLDKAKRAFATRRIPKVKMRTLITGSEKPRAGDLVLAAVAEVGGLASAGAAIEDDG